MIKVLRINKNDNVIIALDSIKKGEKYKVEEYIWIAKENINFGHKIALTDIPKNESVIKYGEEIGYAIQGIKRGDWVHKHNLQSNQGCLKEKKVNTDEI